MTISDLQKNGVTLGNLLSMIVTLGSMAVVVVTMSLAYGVLQANDRMHDEGIRQNKEALSTARASRDVQIADIIKRLDEQRVDHDLLIEMRSDLKALLRSLPSQPPLPH